MASLQQLRKRLRSIRSTGQIADAMRTGATAKFAKLSRTRLAFSPYADACGEMLAQLGAVGIRRSVPEAKKRNAFLILSGDRGFCGGFHAELLRFAEAELAAEPDALLLVSGKKAQSRCRELGLAFEPVTVSDVPTFAEARAICERLRTLYETGEAENIYLIYQHYQNMLTQTPTRLQLLPAGEENESGAAEALLLPDRETVGEQLAVFCMENRLYRLLLEHSSGAQASTQTAMRAASDNAAESAAKLELFINRRRQAEVTAGVIETSSGLFAEKEH